MPIHSYACDEKHTTEVLYKTFQEAENWDKIYVPCGELGCYLWASPVKWEVPFPAHLYGPPGGYYKPSPTQRHSYSHTNSTGNPGNFGYESPRQRKERT